MAQLILTESASPSTPGTNQVAVYAKTDGKLYYKDDAGSETGPIGSSAATVSSVDVSGGTTGLTTSGGPVTTTGTITLAGTLNLANGGTGASLTDPNADRIMFWDDSAGQVTWLTAGTGLTITGTTIEASGGSGDVVGPASATDGNVVLFDGTTGKLIKNSSYDPTTFLVTSNIGSTVQAYDADTAKLDVDQTWSGAQRGTLTTDNDGSFDLNVTNNFFCTPAGSITLTFTNHTSGQSGFVLLDNSGGYAVSAAATTKVDASFLSTVSTAGVYLISYLDNGTNAYCVCSGALS